MLFIWISAKKYLLLQKCCKNAPLSISSTANGNANWASEAFPSDQITAPIQNPVSRPEANQQAALFCTNYRNWSWILWNLKPERTSVASILTVNVTQALKPYPDIAALTPKTTVQIKHFNSQKPNAVSAAGKNVSNLQCPLKGKTCIWWHTQIPPCRWQHYLVEVPLKSDPWGKNFPKSKSGFQLDLDTQRNSSHPRNKKDLLHHHRALFHLLWSHLLLASVDSEGSHLNPKTHLTSDSLRKSFSCTAGHQQIPGTSRHDHCLTQELLGEVLCKGGNSAPLCQGPAKGAEERGGPQPTAESEQNTTSTHTEARLNYTCNLPYESRASTYITCHKILSPHLFLLFRNHLSSQQD